MEFLEALFKIVGGLVVAVVVLLVIAYYGLRFWIRRRIGDGLKALDHGGYGNPIRITLARHHDGWHHEDAVLTLNKQALELGFFEIDKFSVNEMPDIFMWTYFHPAQSAALIVYDHPMAGVWFDVVTRYPDGSNITVTTTRTPPVVVIPEDITVRDPDLALRAALDRLVIERKPGPFVDLGPDHFIEEFEAAYARYMDFVIRQGDVSETFVRESGKALGVTHTFKDEEYAEARAVQNEQLRMRAAEACLDNFVRHSGLSASQWEACRDRALVVHERLTSDEVVQAFCSYLHNFAEDDARVIAVKNRHSEPLTLFEALNQLLTEKGSYLRLGEVEQPVKAHIYLGPR